MSTAAGLKFFITTSDSKRRIWITLIWSSCALQVGAAYSVFPGLSPPKSLKKRSHTPNTKEPTAYCSSLIWLSLFHPSMRDPSSTLPARFHASFFLINPVDKSQILTLKISSSSDGQRPRVRMGLLQVELYQSKKECTDRALGDSLL